MFKRSVLFLFSILLYIESGAIDPDTKKREDLPVVPMGYDVCKGSTTTLNNLTIAETANNDFNFDQVNSQQIEIAPAPGGNFNITSGNITEITVTYGNGATVEVDPSSVDGILRINFTETSSEHREMVNTLTISGLVFEGTSAGAVNILYVSSIRPIHLAENTTIATVTVHDDKPIGIAGTHTICTGQQLDYDLVPLITNGVPSNFEWQATADNPEVEGESTEAHFESVINSTLIHTTGIEQQVQYSVIPRSTAGVCQGEPFLVTITVNPAPVVGEGPEFGSACNNVEASVNLQNYIDNNVPATFTWIGNADPNISGITTTLQAGNVINDVLVKSGAKSSAIYTITSTSVEHGCTAGFSVSIQILDPPVIEAGSEQSYCPDETPIQLSEASSPFGQVTWSVLDQPAGGNGNLSMTTPTSEPSLVTFAASIPGNYTLRLTSVAEVCPAVHDDVVITLLSPPSAGIDANAAVCNTETSFTILAALGGTPDAGGEWSDLNGSGAVFNGVKVDFTAVAPGTYQFEYTAPEGCSGGDNTATLTVTVHQPLFAGNSTSASACSNETAFDLIKPLGGANTGGTWADVNTSGAIITGNNADLTGVTPAAYTFRYTVAGNAGCANGASADVSLTVKPLPVTTVTNNAPLIGSSGSTNIALSSNIPGSTFEYFATAPSEITGATSGSESPISQTLHNSTALQQVVTYTITATAEGCTGPQATTTLTIRGNPTISQADSLLLVNLYQSTNGSQWTIHTNWLTGPANTWHGIKVTDKRATGISLPSNNLTGTIPMQFGDLAILDTVDLSNNKLTGELPATVTGLNLLKRLDVSNNQLSGPVPSAMGAISSIEELYLNKNKFTGIVPASLATSATLRVCNLSDNQFTTLPDFSATTLSLLDVSANRLTFATLEPNMGIASIVYAPQDSLGLKRAETIQTETPYTLTATVDGSANQYQWKKNGVSINGATASTYTITSPVFADEGTYTFEVTNTIVPDLTLQGRPVALKVSSLRRDSLSLVQLYNETGGTAWTNRTGWLTERLSAWNGITVSANRVTAISLSGNNLTGKVPTAISDMLSLTNINFSNNKITLLPSITTLKQLTAVNVSGNSLDFASLEPNASRLSIITYANQAEIGKPGSELQPAGTPYSLSVTAGGTSNVYQWKLNNAAVSGATASQYNITALNRNNMGEYICEITNTVVPGLTLLSAPKTILATSDLSGRLLINATTPATQGIVTLLRITAKDGYDTVQVNNVNADGSFKFEKTVLADYQVVGFPDPATYENVLPTYYERTILWEEADTIVVNDPVTDLDIVAEFKPTDAPSGRGVIRGYVEKDDGLPEGRIRRVDRVKGAGVSVRRVENTGRGKAIILILVAYVFTDENGEFEIPNLPVAEYRINIQYPGYPMDENSFITIPIGTGLQSQVQVEAQVTTEGKIAVRQAIVTGISGVEKYEATVYPNPASAFINICFGTESPSRSVKMIDLTGKEIQSRDAAGTETSIDIRATSPGNYLLNIHDKGIIVKTLQVIVK